MGKYVIRYAAAGMMPPIHCFRTPDGEYVSPASAALVYTKSRAAAVVALFRSDPRNKNSPVEIIPLDQALKDDEKFKKEQNARRVAKAKS